MRFGNRLAFVAALAVFAGMGSAQAIDGKWIMTWDLTLDGKVSPAADSPPLTVNFVTSEDINTGKIEGEGGPNLVVKVMETKRGTLMWIVETSSEIVDGMPKQGALYSGRVAADGSVTGVWIEHEYSGDFTLKKAP